MQPKPKWVKVRTYGTSKQKTFYKVRLYRCVFKSLLNCSTDEAFRMVMGREFQLWGPAMENARSPAFLEVRGTTRLDCERRPSRLGLLRSSMSEMYDGKMLDTVLYMFNAVLKTIRWLTGSQWRSMSRGVTWEYFGFRWISRAALFWSFWRRFRSCCPYTTL